MNDGTECKKCGNTDLDFNTLWTDENGNGEIEVFCPECGEVIGTGTKEPL